MSQDVARVLLRFKYLRNLYVTSEPSRTAICVAFDLIENELRDLEFDIRQALRKETQFKNESTQPIYREGKQGEASIWIQAAGEKDLCAWQLERGKETEFALHAVYNPVGAEHSALFTMKWKNVGGVWVVVSEYMMLRMGRAKQSAGERAIPTFDMARRTMKFLVGQQIQEMQRRKKLPTQKGDSEFVWKGRHQVKMRCQQVSAKSRAYHHGR